MNQNHHVLRFNPLHCGAVVASSGARRRIRARRMGFNPLHCGAVVASTPPAARRAGKGGKFQSPSLRGSGRFSVLSDACTIAPPAAVSIPFIAGQWSLRRNDV